MTTPDQIKVGLSTTSVYPLGVAATFELAARLGYDGVEVMVWTDPLSQDAGHLSRLSAHYDLPILALHAPTLLIAQRVWGKDPWAKITRTVDLADHLDVDTVVAHPPFRWQVRYAEDFVAGVEEISATSGVRVAVENMFPWRTQLGEAQAYVPSWDPTEQDYEAMTLDLSHAATAGVDSLALAKKMGSRLRHVHLTDGSGSYRDEHLVPGRGAQPCDKVLQHLATSGFDGHVIVEVNTRKAGSAGMRTADLAETLTFARRHVRVCA